MAMSTKEVRAMKRVKREKVNRKLQLIKELYDLYMSKPAIEQGLRAERYLSIAYSLTIPELQFEIALEKARRANNLQEVTVLLQRGTM